MSETTPPKPIGTVVGYVQERAGLVLPDGSFISDMKVYRFLDILLENSMGMKKLVRLPVNQDVGDFFAGQAGLPTIHFRDAPQQPQLDRSLITSGNPVDIGRLEEERQVRESFVAPIGTATPPQPTGLNCPVCGELQYLTTSGTTCENGHGGEVGISGTIDDGSKVRV